MKSWFIKATTVLLQTITCAGIFAQIMSQIKSKYIIYLLNSIFPYDRNYILEFPTSGTTIIPVTTSTTKKDKHKLATRTTIYHYKMLIEIGFQK